MSKRVVDCLRAVMVIVALIGTPLLRPGPVLAASGTLTMETPLHDSPDPAAPVIALLEVGTVVTIDGPPVDGYYPVITSGLSGWMRGETVQVEKDSPEPEAAGDVDADPLVGETNESAPVDSPAELDPATDPALSTMVDPTSDPAADTLAGETAPPVAEPAPGAEAAPVAEAVPADEPAPETALASGDQPAPEDAAAVAPAPALDSSETPVPVASNGESPPSESTLTASETAAEPTMNPDVTPIPVVEFAPVGPASVSVDAPILAGPGPGYGFIATAPSGSTVEKTGHLIDGYVTVQYDEVTGWVAIEHLGAPSAVAEETPPGGSTAPVETSLAEAPPAETPPPALAPTETPPAQTPPSDTPTVETAPAEATPVDTAPVDMAPVDAP